MGETLKGLSHCSNKKHKELIRRKRGSFIVQLDIFTSEARNQCNHPPIVQVLQAETALSLTNVLHYFNTKNMVTQRTSAEYFGEF